MKKKQMIINMSSNLFAFVVNILMSFFLTPYLIRLLGKEAYSFYPLANNFIEYANIITIALNAVAARFVSVEYHKGDMKRANKYFSSIIIADAIMGLIMMLVGGLIIFRLESFIRITPGMITDVKFLFGFVFLNFIINLVSVAFGVCTIIKNRLELTSLRKLESTLLKFGVTLMLLLLLPPKITYIGIGAFTATIFVFVTNIIYTRVLTPEIKISVKNFDKKCVKNVISSGVWNSFIKLSDVLFTGFDLLLANLFLGLSRAGELSISKTVPNFVFVLTATVVSVFVPQIFEAYAKKDINSVVNAVRYASKIVSVLVNIPIIILMIVGVEFYALWVPQENAVLLADMTLLTLVPSIIDGSIGVLRNTFIALNKLKTPAIVMCIMGWLNILSMIFMLIFVPQSGVYALIIPTLIIRLLYSLFFTVPYAAHCLGKKMIVFYDIIIRNAVFAAVLICGGLLLNKFFFTHSWIMLVVKCCVIGVIALVLGAFIILNGNDRRSIADMIKAKLVKGASKNA